MPAMTHSALMPKVPLSSDVAIRALEERLCETQRAVVRQRLTAGGLWLGLAIALGLASIAIADYFWEFSIAWRAAGLAGLLGMFVVASRWGWNRWIAPYTLSRAAADAEEHATQFGQRLRTTLDYEHQTPRPSAASPMLLAAMHSDTCQMAAKTNWNDVVDVRPAFVAFTVAAVVGFSLSVALVGSSELRIAAGRTLLLPLEYTTVTYVPQSSIVRLGESVEVKAEVMGRPIESALLRYRPAGTQEAWAVLELAPAEEPDKSEKSDQHSRLTGELLATLADLQHDLEFEILAGPRPLAPGSIQVLQPLTLERSKSRVVPPAYTRRQEQTVEGLDLKVLEGATVEVTLVLNRPAAETRFARIEGNAASKSKHDDTNSPDATASGSPVVEIPAVIEGNTIGVTLNDLRQSVTFAIWAKAADGIELAPQRLTIRVQLDRPPEVKFIEPPEELVVTPTTEVPMVIEASDDIELNKMGIVYQVGAGEMETLFEYDAAGSDELVRSGEVLLLEELRVTHKDAITYYAYAEDNYFGQVRRTVTPLRYIDIRPYSRAYQLVEGESEGMDSGSSLTLEELIVRQRQNLSLSFAADNQKSIENETFERLREAQGELLEKTREFEQGMVERVGLIPTLARAVRDMEEAVAAFDANEISPAINAEQEALANLIRTRENVRQKLSLSNSRSASAARKFDREQRQKLRLPEKKKQDKQQQLADIRKLLDDLAKRERQWSQECKACNNPSSSSSSSSKEQGEKSAEPTEPGDSQSKPPSAVEVAADQEKMHAELADLRDRLEQVKAAGAAARDHARRADESMQHALEGLKKEDSQAAAKEGERAAQQLEQLSDHLAAMNARDFGQRLEEADKLARKLAGRQAALEKKLGSAGSPQEDTSQAAASSEGEHSSEDLAAKEAGQEKKSGRGMKSREGAHKGAPMTVQQGEELARDQQALAGEADLLADQLEALERDATTERGGMKRKLAEIREENPPRDIAGVMSRAASDLKATRQDQAGRGVTQARQRLDELSKSLGGARGEYAQPQLEELVALEEQVAKFTEQMKRAHEKAGEGSAAKAKWRELEERLTKLASADKRLAGALREMHDGGREVPEGHYSGMELGDFNGIRQVSKVLQTRIQEAILAGTLMDADQSVPPAYKDLVDKYYRALSDDLR